MKLTKELIPITLVLVVLAAISIFSKGIRPARSQQDAGVEYTSYSTEKNGTKALYLLLKELGYCPRRLRMPNLTGMSADGLTIVLAPDPLPISEVGAKRLLEWVQQGNTVLFAPAKREDQLAQSLGIELHQGQPMKTSLAPLALTEITAGIQRLAVQSGNRLHTERMDAVRHFGDSGGGVAISFREGAGTVIALSDPYPATNEGLREGDNLNLLVNVLFSFVTDSKTVYFDEYHHGYERRPTILHLLKGTSIGWALIQVVLAIILLLYSRGRRFGRPKSVFEETHRSSTEYVTSLAGIYQNAQASFLALLNLYERLTRSVAWAKPNRSIMELMDECRRKIASGEISEKELIDLSRRTELALRPEEGRQT
jgi:hypothetical protein